MKTIIIESRSNSTEVVENHWKKRSTFFPGYEDARKRCWFLVASTILWNKRSNDRYCHITLLLICYRFSVPSAWASVIIRNYSFFVNDNAQEKEYTCERLQQNSFICGR